MSEDCIFCKIINGDFNTEFVYSIIYPNFTAYIT